MAILEALETTNNLFPLRRARTEELITRYPFAAQWLRLYRELLPVQERAFQATRADAPAPHDVSTYVAQRVMAEVVDITIRAGPLMLARGAGELFIMEDLNRVVEHWLRGQELSPVLTYLARASAGPVLEAMGPSAGLACAGPTDEGHCPRCGGSPQLAYFAVSGEALVTGPRYLVCSRCAHNWVYTRMVCAGCGETSTSRLPIYQEAERFPHVRVDGCESCHRYLLTVDLRKDGRAVPAVDELAAVPLDLYARDRGLTKIVANLMGN